MPVDVTSIMMEVFAVFLMLLVLSVLIIVHEFGHFSVARFFGFQTPVFGFGLPFGPYWDLGERWGTRFRFHLAVLGGYVAIPELGDESAAREDAFGIPLKPFRKFPIWQRALVAFAGPAFNLIFALFIMIALYFCLGEPSQKVSVNMLPPENPIAARAGVKVGDIITAIDDVPISGVGEIITYLGKHPSQPVVLHLDRKGQPVDITCTTNDRGKVGMALDTVGPVIYKRIAGSPFEVVGRASEKTWQIGWNMVEATGMMFGGMVQNVVNPPPAGQSAPKGQLSFKDMHGVLMVVAMGADIAQQDWSQLVLFTILISLDLAIINLLPIPALDGGHLAFMTLEALRGKPMHEQVQGEIVKWGFISLLFLMAVIMVNDVRALITGEFHVKGGNNKDKSGQTSTRDANSGPQVPVSKD